MKEQPVSSPIFDPVVHLPVGEEVYQLIYDYNVAKAIARWTGVNPLISTLYPALETPDGLEISIWACLTQMGKEHEVPQDQRNIKREEVVEWCHNLSWLIEIAGPAIIQAYLKSTPTRKKEDLPPDPNSPKTQTATT
jgi:hypothetical protein